MDAAGKLGLIYLASETLLRFSRRSGAGTRAADRGSLALLWVAIGGGVAAGIWLSHAAQFADFGLTPVTRGLAVAGFAAGLALRWWAILTLGKLFTVDVAIAADHRLVIRGPFRWMRHPSYTGMMLAFAALGVTFQNWLALASLLIPIALALAYRIRIEETVLVAAFGDDYRRYALHTKRLIPGLF